MNNLIVKMKSAVLKLDMEFHVACLLFCSLPKEVKRRLKALKKLQFKTIEIESKFYEEVHQLECKYASQYAPLFDRVSLRKFGHLHAC